MKTFRNRNRKPPTAVATPAMSTTTAGTSATKKHPQEIKKDSIKLKEHSCSIKRQEQATTSSKTPMEKKEMCMAYRHLSILSQWKSQNKSMINFETKRQMMRLSGTKCSKKLVTKCLPPPSKNCWQLFTGRFKTLSTERWRSRILRRHSSPTAPDPKNQNRQLQRKRKNASSQLAKKL